MASILHTDKVSKNDFEKYRKELLSSMRYARYIQDAVLPSEKELYRIFSQYFIVNLPRDIVSGDFYWATKRKHHVFWAVADCTGHGVPGALMSILGVSLLNEVILRNRFKNAADILNQTREHVMKALHQTGQEREQKDGMDLGLCYIDTIRHTLNYSGAYNPLYIVRNGILIEIKADRMPIGIAPFEEKSFTNTSYQLQKGDMLYLFTDGFVDQFGGTKGEKFKYPAFRRLLTTISGENMEKQNEIILDTYRKWKGKEAQTDDILLMGMRYI